MRKILMAGAACAAIASQVAAADKQAVLDTYMDIAAAGYADSLELHDMGPGLADGRPEATASGDEWRTPPVWGIGLTDEVSGHAVPARRPCA